MNLAASGNKQFPFLHPYEWQPLSAPLPPQPKQKGGFNGFNKQGVGLRHTPGLAQALRIKLSS